MNYAFVGNAKWALLLLVLGLAACQSPVETLMPSPTLLMQTIRIETPTPAPNLGEGDSAYQALPLYTPNATPPPPPTPTPYTYKVKKEDTLLGIAIRHGIKLEELQAANPDVNARMLSVGTVLIVPLPTAAPDTNEPPQPTIIPVVAESAACYAAEQEGLWCFTPLKNEGPDPLESLSAWLTLYTAEGEVLTTTQVALLLNVLPPGQSLPLVLFVPDADDQVSLLEAAQVNLISAFALPPGDPRYLPAQLTEPQTEILEGGLTASFTAEVVFPAPEAAPTSTPAPTDPAATSAAGETPPEAEPVPPVPIRILWLAAVAYGEDGQVVGVRRFEWTVEIYPGEQMDVSGSVYSAGPPIARVVLVVEARP